MEFIAEIGINHGGDLALATEMVVAAKKSGATTAKFQTYLASERVPRQHPLFDLLVDCELSIEDFAVLKNVCANEGIQFLTTVFGLESLAMAKDLGLGRVKLASFSVSDEILVTEAVQQRFDLIISTGVSSWKEIVRCSQLVSVGAGNHVFLHCISEYPVSDPSHLNLVNIQKLRELTGGTVGFSDHSLGPEAFFLAALVGAEVFEKHFTTDRSLPGPDQLMSADSLGLRDCIQEAQRAIDILGERRDSRYSFEQGAETFKNVSRLP